MNVWIAIFAVIMVILMPGCSIFDTKDEPVSPTLAVTPVVVPTTEVTEVTTPTPIEVPRITQVQTIGILRELRANGCMITKFADTDGIHYSQLVVNCGPPQAIPEVE